jgi:glutamyl-tRNA reductase
MSLCAVGLNHRSAPLALRERVAFGLDELSGALRDLTARREVDEAVIVSTCNRTDVYCGLAGDDPEPVLGWLGRSRGFDAEAIRAHGYIHRGGHAVRHVMRVASGLDSLVLGEPQVLGQVKRAYRTAAETGALGVCLGRLFPAAFSAAKQVRTQTAIGASPVSVASAAVSVARGVFGDFSQLTGLVVGAGETGELLARHLHSLGIGQLIVANRTVSRATRLAGALGGYAVGLDGLAKALGGAHVILCAADCAEPLVLARDLEAATGRGVPVFVADLGVPRNVEEAVGALRDVYLYTVDDLQAVADEGHRTRSAAVERAETILEGRVAQFGRWLGEREVVPVVRALRQRAESNRDAALARARRRLAAGDPPEEVLARLAHSLTNTLLHAPTVGLRVAGAAADAETVERARGLFGIDAGRALGTH